MTGVYADTELLRSDSFAAFVEHMRGVIDTLETTLDGLLPVADTIRDDSDQILVDGIRDQIRMILIGLRDLSQGDANQVAVLGQLLDQVEDLNTDVANFGGGTTT